MSKKDGGPAFPEKHYDENGDEYYPDGMTLRDYFAGQATATDVDWMICIMADNQLPADRASARWAYADLMIAERDK